MDNLINIINIKDDNVKSFILDPLSTIVKLAILSCKPVGTKLLIYNNVIYFQEPGPFQSLCRFVYKSNKTDLQYLFNPIYLACEKYLSKSFVKNTPTIINLFICAQNGIKKLTETYKNCSILSITLNYYSVILSNYINKNNHDPCENNDVKDDNYENSILNDTKSNSDEISANEYTYDNECHKSKDYYDSTIFVKNNFTSYYTPVVCEPLYNQWNKKNIKIILDLISFLINNESENNVKSLENIMENIDMSTRNNINIIF
jgi:hypothetical protein